MGLSHPRSTLGPSPDKGCGDKQKRLLPFFLPIQIIFSIFKLVDDQPKLVTKNDAVMAEVEELLRAVEINMPRIFEKILFVAIIFYAGRIAEVF